MVCCAAACCISATAKLTFHRWISSIFCKYRRFWDSEEACSTHVPGVQPEPMLSLASSITVGTFAVPENFNWVLGWGAPGPTSWHDGSLGDALVA